MAAALAGAFPDDTNKISPRLGRWKSRILVTYSTFIRLMIAPYCGRVFGW